MIAHGDKPAEPGPVQASPVQQIFPPGVSAVRQSRARLLAAGVAGASLAVAAAVSIPDEGLLIIVAAWAVCTALIVLVAFPSARLGTVAGTAAVSSLAVTLVYRGPADNGTAGWWLVESAATLLALHLVVRRAAARPAALAGSALAVATVVLPLRLTLHLVLPATSRGALIGCLVFALAAAAAAGTGLYLRFLDVRRARSVTEARRAQRLELARDLHDFVAHEISGMIVQAQAGQVGGEASDVLQRIERAGLRAMSSLDRTVAMLHDDGPPVAPYGLDELPGLVDRFRTTSRARIGLAVDAGSPPLEVSATTYRLIVEALTNVRRHAPDATAVDITVTATGQAIDVTVTNDGRTGRRHPLRSRRRGGLGLPGIAARVEALGGDLAVGPTGDRNWVVSARIPVQSPP